MITMKTRITAALMAAMMVLTIVPFLGADDTYAATNKGNYTMDLSEGPKVLKYTDDYARALSNSLNIMEDEGIIGYRDEDPVFTPDLSNGVIHIKYAMYYDLDKDGKNDIKLSGETTEKIATDGPAPNPPSVVELDSDDPEPEMVPTVTMEKASTCSIKDRITVSLPSKIVKSLEGASEEESFFSSVTFVFSKSAAVKKANTLKVKGKAAQVKLSKLNKKAQTLSVSSVIKFKNRGQGPLRYKKVSGNKKITIDKKTGKVTVRKGLNKGTYKVKVKVKAIGNKNYKASAYKPATFTIKVK